MIQVKGLTRAFGDKVAVDDVSFTVADGEMTGFVGGNGAGKTTTMRMVMGVLEPNAGEVLWNGSPITMVDRRRVGYMPEERGLYPKQPLTDQLVYLARLRGMDATAARDRAHTLLERFGLGDRAKDKLETLSLGNQQRVQIAAAVITDPDALILDEPFSGLDPNAVDEMAALLREFTTAGKPVLFSSHQLDLVERLCDSLVILSKGRVVAQGEATEIRRSGPVRHRLVLDSDAGWVRDMPGVQVISLDGPSAVVELADPDADGDALVREALRHGKVREFGEIVPQLSEIYREVA